MGSAIASSMACGAACLRRYMMQIAPSSELDSTDLNYLSIKPRAVIR